MAADKRSSGGGVRNSSRATLGDYLRDPIKATYKDRRVAEASVRRKQAARGNQRPKSASRKKETGRARKAVKMPSIRNR